MNTLEVHLEELRVDSSLLKEVLRCLVHTILFNRFLHCVGYTDCDSGLFSSITYPRIEDATLIRQVEEKIEALTSGLKRPPVPSSSSSFQQPLVSRLPLRISLFDIHAHSGMFSSEKRHEWERWNIAIIISWSTGPGQANIDSLQRDLKSRLLAISRMAEEKKDHLPPVTAEASVTKPDAKSQFEIFRHDQVDSLSSGFANSIFKYLSGSSS